MTPEEAGLSLLDGAVRGDADQYNQICDVLVAQPGLTRVEHPAFRPFYIAARYDDVTHIEQNNTLFLSGPNPVLTTLREDEALAATGGAPPIRTLIHMDDPEHRQYRKVTVDWFQARTMNRYREPLEALAKHYVDRIRHAGGVYEFADAAMHFPLTGILAILGLPETDHELMLKLTQEYLTPQDPDVSVGGEVELAPAAIDMEAMLKMFAYFGDITKDRRANPCGDLASTIANAEVNGCPLNDLDTMSYYAIFAVAGHDTTSAAIAGGMHALIDNPDQLRLLQNDPGLMSSAVEEIIRWASPVKYFMRTVSEDTELAGTLLKKGDRVMAHFGAANRDPQRFAEPAKFDIQRDFNRHIAFGLGTHFCLGAPFARMELDIFFTELLRQLDSVEAAGPYAERQTISPVGGCKSLPVRCTFRTPALATS